MNYYNIPLLLLYQSKKTDTFSGIKMCYSSDSPYYYIIRVQNKLCNDGNDYNIFSLHLWSTGKNSKNKMSTIRYSTNKETQIIRKLLNEIKKDSNIYDFDEYLLTKEL